MTERSLSEIDLEYERDALRASVEMLMSSAKIAADHLASTDRDTSEGLVCASAFVEQAIKEIHDRIEQIGGVRPPRLRSADEVLAEIQNGLVADHA